MGGQVSGMFGNLPEQRAAIKSGKTRALAVSSSQRNAQIPEVPTDKLHATLVKTLGLPEIVARLADNSIEATPTLQEEFAAFIRAETERWARVVKDANIPKQ
jgi:tripartite-type tricarboxylate transporter receptor subunit TctC